MLDDLHLLYDTSWLKPFLHRLLLLLPEETHLLIAARSLPSASLWRFRAKQRLRVIDELALLFTLPETEELFAYYGLSLESGRKGWRHMNGGLPRSTVSLERLVGSLSRHNTEQVSSILSDLIAVRKGLV